MPLFQCISQENSGTNTFTLSLKTEQSEVIFNGKVTVTYHSKQGYEMWSTLSFTGIEGISDELQGPFQDKILSFSRGKVFYIRVGLDSLYRGKIVREYSQVVTIDFQRSSSAVSYDTASLASIAEDQLGSLAHSARVGRYIVGIFGLAVGIPVTVGGVILAGDTKKEGAGAIFIVGGLVLNGASIWRLSTQTFEEDEYTKVKDIIDIHQKDSIGYKALKSFAKKGRNYRKSGIGASVVSSLWMFLRRPLKKLEYEVDQSGWPKLVEKDDSMNDVFGAFFAATALYGILVKTPAENSLQEYEKARNSSNTFSIRIGTDRTRGLCFGLVYSF